MKQFGNPLPYLVPFDLCAFAFLKQLQGPFIHLPYSLIRIFSIAAPELLQMWTSSADIICSRRYFHVPCFCFLQHVFEIPNKLRIISLAIKKMEADEMMSSQTWHGTSRHLMQNG